jgi:hypothetical protein
MQYGAQELFFGRLSELLAGLLRYLDMDWVLLVSFGANLLFTLLMCAILQ